MRADYLNTKPTCTIEDFAEMIISVNSNLAEHKMKLYGIVEEKVSCTNVTSLDPISSHRNKDTLLRAKHCRDISGHVPKLSNEELKKTVFKNPFKKKLKLQMGL